MLTLKVVVGAFLVAMLVILAVGPLLMSGLRRREDRDEFEDEEGPYS